MNMQEKILYLRKKAGYSQEALAEKLGVSRQAVSKWENGDAEPELSKIRSLTELFDVSIDWLLSEEEPKDAVSVSIDKSISQSSFPTWVEDAPGFIGKLLKRYGWLFGLYISFTGLLFAGMGTLGRVMVSRMFSPGLQDPFGVGMGADPFFDAMVKDNPVTLLSTFIQFFGLFLILAGAVIALLLFQYRKKESS